MRVSGIFFYSIICVILAFTFSSLLRRNLRDKWDMDFKKDWQGWAFHIGILLVVAICVFIANP